MEEFKTKIFKNITFADVLEKVYETQKEKEKQIKSLINDLKPLITNTGDATVLVPLIKEYLGLSIKNDEQLTKMAGIVQRALVKSNRDSNDNNFILSEKEKNDLLKAYNDSE